MRLCFASTCPEPRSLSYRIEKIVYRSQTAFTEGLVYVGGFLYESAGLYGHSAINKINPITGKVTSLVQLSDFLFGEGLDFWNSTFMQLTWLENILLLWKKDLSLPPRVRNYPWQGWGLTHDAHFWIASDGTSTLHFLDPKDFNEEKALRVKKADYLQDGLNELEFAEGRVFANVFPSDEIVQINPQTGCVVGTLDLSVLHNNLSTFDGSTDVQTDPNSVLNGIAYDSDHRVFYVAGKNWKVIYQIALN